MGIKQYLSGIFAGRKTKVPERDTEAYPRLMQLGNIYNRKAQYKASPPNIRYFTRTSYVRRAISRIREPIAALPWVVVPEDGVKFNKVLESQAELASNCLKHPNNDDSWRTLIGMVVEDALTFGAGVIELQLGGDAVRPLWMWGVDAQSIQIYPGWAGGRNEARYMQTIGYTNVGLLQGRKLRNDEIVYIKINDSTETPYGFGPVEIAFNAINRQLSTAKFCGDLAGNAQPQFAINFPGVDQAWIRAFRDYWQDEIEGRGKIPILGGSKEKAEVLRFFPGGDEAMYLKYQDFVIREVATAFNLSPQNLGIEADVNRNTSEVAEDRDWDTAIKPLAELIESYITREILHAKLGFYQLEFKFPTLEREDEESLANIYEIEYKNNAITPNEYREKRGQPPLEGEWGDKVFVDTQIAIMASRGTSVIEDSDLRIDQKTGGNSTNNNQKSTKNQLKQE